MDDKDFLKKLDILRIQIVRLENADSLRIHPGLFQKICFHCAWCLQHTLKEPNSFAGIRIVQNPKVEENEAIILSDGGEILKRVEMG